MRLPKSLVLPVHPLDPPPPAVDNYLSYFRLFSNRCKSQGASMVKWCLSCHQKTVKLNTRENKGIVTLCQYCCKRCYPLSIMLHGVISAPGKPGRHMISRKKESNDSNDQIIHDCPQRTARTEVRLLEKSRRPLP